MKYCFTCSTKNEVVNYLERDSVFKNSIKKQMSFEFTKDLIQDVFLIILESPEENIMRLNDNGEIIFWLYAIIRNQLNVNHRTKTYEQYRKETKVVPEKVFSYYSFKEQELNIISEENKHKRENSLKEELNKMNKSKINHIRRLWLEQYINGQETIQEMANRLKIDKWNLVYGLRQIKEDLKQNILKNEQS